MTKKFNFLISVIFTRYCSSLLYIFGHVRMANVCRRDLFGHVQIFWSYSFGHLESVKWGFLLQKARHDELIRESITLQSWINSMVNDNHEISTQKRKNFFSPNVIWIMVHLKAIVLPKSYADPDQESTRFVLSKKDLNGYNIWLWFLEIL